MSDGKVREDVLAVWALHAPEVDNWIGWVTKPTAAPSELGVLHTKTIELLTWRLRRSGGWIDLPSMADVLATARAIAKSKGRSLDVIAIAPAIAARDGTLRSRFHDPPPKDSELNEPAVVVAFAKRRRRAARGAS